MSCVKYFGIAHFFFFDRKTQKKIVSFITEEAKKNQRTMPNVLILT